MVKELGRNNYPAKKASFSDSIKFILKTKSKEEKNIKSIDKELRASGCSVLSVVYFTVEENALVHLKTIVKNSNGWSVVLTPIWIIAWLPLATYCHWRMCVLSNNVVELIGYKKMSSVQCNIRQRILLKKSRFTEAETAIISGLNKRKSWYTYASLKIGMSKICQQKGCNEKAEEYMLRSIVIAKNKIQHKNPAQAAEIYRRCAEIGDGLPEHRELVYGVRLRHQANKIMSRAQKQSNFL